MFNLRVKKDELFYMKRFDSKSREAWKLSQTEEEGFILARKSLKKAKINKEDHPFLWEFRKKINKINVYSIEGKIEMGLALKEFYDKKRELAK